MATARLGDSPDTTFYRTTRVYTANSLWWFDTREGVQFGPFICRIAAICALAVYVAQYAHEGRNRHAESSAPPGAQDGIAHMVEEILEVLEQRQGFGVTAATNWARSRLEVLRAGHSFTSENIGRIRALEFALRHPEETFDFEYFLRCRAR